MTLVNKIKLIFLFYKVYELFLTNLTALTSNLPLVSLAALVLMIHVLLEISLRGLLELNFRATYYYPLEIDYKCRHGGSTLR